MLVRGQWANLAGFLGGIFNDHRESGYWFNVSPEGHMGFFLHDRALVSICRCRIVFTDSGFGKYSWAHLVMSMTESCR